MVKYSFANLLMIHRPLVIVDEAHNARTGLTFDVLKRVAPSCIIELTATPDTDPRTGSNILHRVSASELKAEALIKLPIVLTEHPTGWQDAVRDALLTRARLAELAAREPDYIRPLLLIQAENRDKPANVEAVKQYLIEDEKIAAERIAIATGDQRELDGIDLFDRRLPDRGHHHRAGAQRGVGLLLRLRLLLHGQYQRQPRRRATVGPRAADALRPPPAGPRPE